MAVLVGIDEAGYGPILGPLVVSSTAFSLPSNLLGADLWQILNKSTSNKRKRLAGRLLIADSKKVYNKSAGIKHLERTILSCLKCLDKSPAALPELLAILCPDCLERLDVYPWHKNIGDYSAMANEADVTVASSVFRDDMASNNIKLLEIKSCCLDVAYYNKMVNNVKNKASVLFTAVCQLIKTAYDNFGNDDLQIIVDRQGGRTRYRRDLLRMFPNMELKILKENPEVSSYQLEANGKSMRLHFAVGGDDRFLPVSLASMVSKYIRELMVDGINRYFAALCPQLKPTAGYWKDGLRFIEDIRKNAPHIRYDSEQLIRCR